MMKKLVGYGGWVEICGERHAVHRFEVMLEPGWKRWARRTWRRLRFVFRPRLRNRG